MSTASLRNDWVRSNAPTNNAQFIVQASDVLLRVNFQRVLSNHAVAIK